MLLCVKSLLAVCKTEHFQGYFPPQYITTSHQKDALLKISNRIVEMYWNNLKIDVDTGWNKNKKSHVPKHPEAHKTTSPRK